MIVSTTRQMKRDFLSGLLDYRKIVLNGVEASGQDIVRFCKDYSEGKLDIYSMFANTQGNDKIGISIDTVG